MHQLLRRKWAKHLNCVGGLEIEVEGAVISTSALIFFAR